jgi:DNA-binding transcriptional regulator of glucitol operon
MPGGRTRPRWLAVLRPKWLCWHAFAVVAFIGMMWLGSWQFHRAVSGNELSWAYTFEWPLFAIFGVYFWVRTVREELRNETARRSGLSAPERSDQTTAVQAEDAEAYMARLRAEVRATHGRRP